MNPWRRDHLVRKEKKEQNNDGSQGLSTLRKKGYSIFITHRLRKISRGVLKTCVFFAFPGQNDDGWRSRTMAPGEPGGSIDQAEMRRHMDFFMRMRLRPTGPAIIRTSRWRKKGLVRDDLRKHAERQAC